MSDQNHSAPWVSNKAHLIQVKAWVFSVGETQRHGVAVQPERAVDSTPEMMGALLLSAALVGILAGIALVRGGNSSPETCSGNNKQD